MPQPERSPSAAKERAEIRERELFIPLAYGERIRRAEQLLARFGGLIPPGPEARREIAEKIKAQVDALAGSVAADRLPDPAEPQNVTEGMPPELVRALRDPTIRLPQDDYKLADGRSLWEHLQEWRNAPSDTASGGPVSAAVSPAAYVPHPDEDRHGPHPSTEGPAVSPAEPPERAQQVQRGLEPAKTLLELVDAIRQDTAGIGACISSIQFIASARGDVPKSVTEWVDRLAFHIDRLESKCALALNGDSDG